MKHIITATYTTDDDGIHLECVCGWRICAGFNPTVEQLRELEAAHMLEHERSE